MGKVKKDKYYRSISGFTMLGEVWDRYAKSVHENVNRWIKNRELIEVEDKEIK
jgi:hypothetical protein